MTEPAPRWATAAAWTVPFLVVPSGIWRVSEAGDSDEAWYLYLLTGLSLALALLTLGLVRSWGERFPPRLVSTLATTGGVLLLTITVYFLIGTAFFPDARGPVLVGADETFHPRPGWDVLRWYLPLVLWGPLLLAVTRDFRRRHRASDAVPAQPAVPA